MSGLASAFPVLAAAAGGGLGALCVREALLASPGAARWIGAAVEPLRRAGAEGYAPTQAERRRLAALVAGSLLLLALALVGPAPAVPLAAVGPATAAWGVGARRRRYRRAVERGLAEIAMATADALAAGRSVRAALESAAGSLEGPPAVEMARIRADLELGSSTAEALAGLRTRLRSPRIDALCAALATHQLAGGDLAELLRRFAAAAAERERIVAEARSATAQARFTGLLVVAMPLGAAALAELADPGFVGGMLRNPISLVSIALAATLQLGGFAAIRRLGRVDGGVS
jgi:tight adherence protein B